jgi:hypothetical protein
MAAGWFFLFGMVCFACGAAFVTWLFLRAEDMATDEEWDRVFMRREPLR